jgi:hypothetical protein
VDVRAEAAKIFVDWRVILENNHVNTGYAIRQTIHALKEAGAEVIGAAALCTRGNINSADAIGVSDFRYLVECKIPAWEASSCHLCRTGVPVNIHYAHGLEFVQSLYK